MKCTQYFLHTRQRPDRAIIRDEWIERVIQHPLREEQQTDGRIRRWARVPEMDNLPCASSCSQMARPSTTPSSTETLEIELRMSISEGVSYAH